jgi:hypothetical protein
MSSPAFQFYPAHYLADANVQMMTLEKEGACLRKSHGQTFQWQKLEAVDSYLSGGGQ